MNIKFCGADREVTGSAHLITLDDGYRILLDCGLYQGRSKQWKDFNENWLFDPKEIDCLILSHAHIDHSGRIPKLVKDGFNGRIYCTHATRSLCAIMLLDSASIQERDADFFNRKILPGKKKASPRTPLYTTEDATEAMNYFEGFSYNNWIQISNGVEVLFKDAGHILGSANVTLRVRDKGKTRLIGFSGDVGRPNRPILRDPQPMPVVDYMICESTYGNKDHIGAPDEADKLLEVIRNTCVEKKGKLIIPAFSVGRTQEIVYMLDRMENEGLLPSIPVYVDSPLAVNATTIFGIHPECYDSDLNEYLLIDDNPFGFNKLTYVKNVDVSKSLNDKKEPCIIISASGMMNAGRVKHHLFNNIDNPKNTLLIVGYCTPETPGGQLRNGVEEIRLFGKMKKVKMDVVVMDSFSAHADRGELLDFLKNQKGHLKKLFLVHGTLDRQEDFKDLLEENGFQNVSIPTLGEVVKLK
ncbi:MAG TPA: MBL fold metallo-hydrolase [Saprospiraceae bacterium]|nr:MBL fold metallo-hydrolase [Saprospiraceae bacterium]